jgi:hypothetical protein
MRTSRAVGAVLVVVATLVASVLAPPRAVAHSNPALSVRFAGVQPLLPRQVKVSLVDSEVTYLELTNTSSTAAYALDADGVPFLAVSSEGVFGDTDSRYLGRTGVDTASAKPANLPCCPSGHWVRLSKDTSWIWADPRLDPPQLLVTQTGGNRGLASLTRNAPLATWKVGLSYAKQTFVASGDVVLRGGGYLRTEVQHVPSGFDVSVIDGRQPQIRMLTPPTATVEVLGDDNMAFIRVSPRGAQGLSESVGYRFHRLAIGLDLQNGSGWVPMEVGGPNKVTWADYRLNHGDVLPIASHQETLGTWTIPLLVDGQREVISGVTIWTPAAAPLALLGPAVKKTKVFAGVSGYLIAGGFTFVLIVAFLFARRRSNQSEVMKGDETCSRLPPAGSNVALTAAGTSSVHSSSS